MSDRAPRADLEPSHIEDATLAEAGTRVLEWTRVNMPLLRRLQEE